MMRKGKDLELNYGNTFATRLCYVLACEGMTQNDLAKKLTLHQSGISHFTCGTRLPPLHTAIEIAKILNVSLDWLCCLED